MSLPRSYTLPREFKFNRQGRKIIKNEHFVASTNSSDGELCYLIWLFIVANFALSYQVMLTVVMITSSRMTKIKCQSAKECEIGEQTTWTRIDCIQTARSIISAPTSWLKSNTRTRTISALATSKSTTWTWLMAASTVAIKSPSMRQVLVKVDRGCLVRKRSIDTKRNCENFN